MADLDLKPFTTGAAHTEVQPNSTQSEQEKPSRKPRATKPAKEKPARDKHEPTPSKAPKDLQKILRAAGDLRETDHEAFEHMLCYCLDLDKASRARVLEAVMKVFA